MHDNNLPQKLEWRLRSIANGSYKSDLEESGQCSLLYVELLVVNGSLIGWLKPEVRPLEPRGINPLEICSSQVAEWQNVISELIGIKKGILILRRGEPVGWLNGTG